MPGERLILRDEHIGMAVAVEVYEFQVWIARAAIQPRVEGAEGVPARALIVFGETRRWGVEQDEVWLPIARQVHELGLPSRDRRIRLRAHKLDRREFRSRALNPVLFHQIDGAEVPLVEPAP